MADPIGNKFDYLGANVEQFCRVDVFSVDGCFVGFQVCADFVDFEREFSECIVSFRSGEFEKSIDILEGDENKVPVQIICR